MQYLFIKRKLLRYKSFLISKMKKYDSNIPIHLQFIILNDKQYYRLKFKYNNSLTNQDQYRQVQQYYRLKFKYNKSLTNQDQYGQVQQYY